MEKKSEGTKEVHVNRRGGLSKRLNCSHKLVVVVVVVENEEVETKKKGEIMAGVTSLLCAKKRR